MKSTTKLVIPSSVLEKGAKLKDGRDMLPTMVGNYYASSVVFSEQAVPQFSTAGDILCPPEIGVKRMFKPKRRKGQFMALKSDFINESSRYVLTKSVAELTSIEDGCQLEKSIDERTRLTADFARQLTYTKADGSVISYSEAIDYINSYQAYNATIQMRIEEEIAKSGYAPKVDENGKTVKRRKFPEDLINRIKLLAEEKKSLTGCMILLQSFGTHTISVDEGYYKSSLSRDELDDMIQRLQYTDRGNYVKGSMFVGTMVVPIQTVKQYEMLMEYLKSNNYSHKVSDWPDPIKDSIINLERVSIEEFE